MSGQKWRDGSHASGGRSAASPRRRQQTASASSTQKAAPTRERQQEGTSTNRRARRGGGRGTRRESARAAARSSRPTQSAERRDVAPSAGRRACLWCGERNLCGRAKVCESCKDAHRCPVCGERAQAHKHRRTCGRRECYLVLMSEGLRRAVEAQARTPCRTCGRPTGTRKRRCPDCWEPERPTLPVAPLLAAVVKACPGMTWRDTATRACLTDRTLRAWRAGRYRHLQGATADRVTTALGLRWEDIWPPEQFPEIAKAWEG